MELQETARGFAGLDLAATQDITAKGSELEISVNSNRYWTVAASGTEMRSVTTNISAAMAQWIDHRIVDPRQFILQATFDLSSGFRV